MKLKLLSYMLILLVLAACRNDHLQDLHYQDEATKSQLVSKIISLNESVHKHKLLPQLKAAKENIKKTMPKNLYGKMVSFGDSISIDTEHVIYIENGPNYHTYTFAIERTNPHPQDPVENLLLTPLPDGTYKEFWMAYNFTEQEKEQIRSGKLFDYAGKVSVKELSEGNFSGSVLQKVVCGYSIGGYYTWCSEGLHNNGKPCNATEYYSEYIIEVSYSCYDDFSPGGDGGGGSGEGGDGNGGGPNGDTNCTSQGSYLQPEDPSLPPNDNCNSGVPTLPNLPPPDRRTPCEKTKQMLQNPEVQEKLGILKEKSKTTGEQGINIAMDGTPSAIIDGEDHEVELGDSAGNKGGYHNHTPTGIPMLSPPDILKLFNYAMNFNNGNVGEAFNGIVGSDVCSACPGGYKYYHYLVRFNGTYQELANLVYANWDKDMYIRTYQRRYNELKKISEYYDSQLGVVNNKGLEKLFFDTLKTMNIENKVILQRVDETGTAPHINYSVQNIILDENNKPRATPCP